MSVVLCIRFLDHSDVPRPTHPDFVLIIFLIQHASTMSQNSLAFKKKKKALNMVGITTETQPLHLTKVCCACISILQILYSFTKQADLKTFVCFSLVNNKRLIY